jgi:DNA repair exonuclease SbcCD nuclease subunit
MEAAGAARLLGDKAISYNGVNIYGANFGQTPPRPRGKGFHVLVAHAMVGDRPLWPGHELTGPVDYMARHPGYNLYLLGDYHYPWEIEEDTVAMFNCGTLIRKTMAERELKHKPKVVLFNTDTMASQDVFLNVSPIETVFDLTENIVQERRDPAVLEVLVAKLRGTGKVGVNFTENLIQYCLAENVPDTIKNIILESLPQSL